MSETILLSQRRFDWLLMPIAIITRMYVNEHPFTCVKPVQQATVDVTS